MCGSWVFVCWLWSEFGLEKGILSELSERRVVQGFVLCCLFVRLRRGGCLSGMFRRAINIFAVGLQYSHACVCKQMNVCSHPSHCRMKRNSHTQWNE